jgi:flagellar motor switch protein FliN/FliY
MSGADFPPNFELLLDVPVKLSVELGCCTMPMKEVLQLSVGSVVQLDKDAESPVELFANQKLVAQGEVVVVDDQFGIKITKIFGSQP